MSRTETLERIRTHLASMDDEELSSVAELIADHAEQADTLPRPLTAHELELIEQSKADFREGRSFSLEEARVFIANRRDELRRSRENQ